MASETATGSSQTYSHGRPLADYQFADAFGQHDIVVPRATKYANHHLTHIYTDTHDPHVLDVFAYVHGHTDQVPPLDSWDRTLALAGGLLTPMVFEHRGSVVRASLMQDTDDGLTTEQQSELSDALHGDADVLLFASDESVSIRGGI